MSEGKRAGIPCEYALFVGRDLILTIGETFSTSTNTGYTPRLDKRARVLLSGQKNSDKSLSEKLDLAARFLTISGNCFLF